MRFYIARYVGTGTELDPFRPAGTDGADWSSIDLRADARFAAGYALVAGPVGLTAARNQLDVLTDDPNDVAAATRSLLETKLGVTLDSGLPFRRLLRQLLTEKAGAGRWKALRAERDAWRIYLGGLIDEVPIVAGGAILTESFNKANSTTLGPDQTWTEVAGDMTVASNKIRPAAATGVQGYARAESDLATSDNYAQIQVVTLTAPTASKFAVIGPCCRFASAATTFYRSHLNDSNGTKVIGLRKVVAGTATTLGADQTVTPTLPSTVYVEANGSTIKSKLDGVQKHSLTDTAIATGVRAGVAVYLDTGVVANCEGDNWRAADLVQTQNLAGAATPTGDAVKQPTKVFVSSTSPSGAATKSTTKHPTGGSTPGGVLTRTTSKGTSGAAASAGAVTRAAAKALTAALVSTGTLSKSTSKPTAGSISPSGLLARLFDRSLTGSVASSGTLKRDVTSILEGEIAALGEIRRGVSQTHDGSISPTGALLAALGRLFDGSISPSGQLARDVSIVRGGSVGSSGSLTRQTSRRMTGVLPSGGALARSTTKQLAGSISSAGGLLRAALKALVAVVAPDGVLSTTHVIGNVAVVGCADVETAAQARASAAYETTSAASLSIERAFGSVSIEVCVHG